jgi:hypothetical protein
MKLKQYFLIIAALSSFCFAGGRGAIAQERPSWGPAVSFPNGTFIQTGIGTIPADAGGAMVSNTSVATAASTTPEQGVFRRILKLSDGRAIIYEIAVKRLDEGKRFEVTLGSWIPTAKEAAEMEIDPARVETNFLSNYSAPLTINDGDMLALDVLINPRTGVKLVDYFRVTSRRPAVRSSIGDLSAMARSIEIRDVEFLVENFDVRLNGNSIYTSKGGMGGRFIWLDVPQTGRFIFSLTPVSETDGFHRSAYLTRQQIIFSNGADKYELTSEHPIIPASGVFYLWVRLDPTFTFPSRLSNQSGNYFSIGAADNLPPQQKRE